MDTIRRTALPLFILRLTLGVFLLQWGGEKLLTPEVGQKIYGHFYFLDLPLTVFPFIGGLQMLLALAIMTGFRKKYSYLAGFLVHSVSTIATWSHLIAPYESGNHLFMTGVPVLAAFWLLWRLRELDGKWSLDNRKKTGPERG